jgi:hypothetical protein
MVTLRTIVQQVLYHLGSPPACDRRALRAPGSQPAQAPRVATLGTWGPEPSATRSLSRKRARRFLSSIPSLSLSPFTVYLTGVLPLSSDLVTRHRTPNRMAGIRLTRLVPCLAGMPLETSPTYRPSVGGRLTSARRRRLWSCAQRPSSLYWPCLGCIASKVGARVRWPGCPGLVRWSRLSDSPPAGPDPRSNRLSYRSPLPFSSTVPETTRAPRRCEACPWEQSRGPIDVQGGR